MKTSVSKTYKIWIVFKGLVHGYGQKLWNVCQHFVLCKMPQEKVFGDVFVIKQAFLETWILKNAKLTFFQKG